MNRKEMTKRVLKYEPFLHGKELYNDVTWCLKFRKLCHSDKSINPNAPITPF